MSELPEIVNQLSSQELFNAFKQQLVRDFDQSNFPSDFVIELLPDYYNIQDKIAYQLKRNAGRTDFNIMHLLYRVDISESQLKRYLNKQKEEDQFMVIAELIIKRVLQKVIIKRFYKAENNTDES